MPPFSRDDSISTVVRRRYILGKQGLWPGRRWTGKEGTAEALRAVEAVQMDPVSVIAQSHHIVLWGRVSGYQAEYLDNVAYKERRFFDYGGGLMIYPIEELPYWRVMMERCKSEKRWADFAQANPALLDDVRQEIRARGPLRSREIEGKVVDHYRAGKDTGVALYYLWLTGELMTHSRKGNERAYDFLENIAPANLQWSATEDDAMRTFTYKAISQLGLISERNFRSIYKGLLERPVDAKEAKSKLAEMIESGQLGAVRLENSQEPRIKNIRLYFLNTDASLLKDLCDGKTPQDWQASAPTTTEEVVFLSLLEYVSARGRARELFNFNYTWEIYKPASQRKYGPYTMPVLYGDQLAARMDAKLDRQSRILMINGFWLEERFKPEDDFHEALAKGLRRFADFLGVERIETTSLNPGSLRSQVEGHLLGGK